MTIEHDRAHFPFPTDFTGFSQITNEEFDDALREISQSVEALIADRPVPPIGRQFIIVTRPTASIPITSRVDDIRRFNSYRRYIMSYNFTNRDLSMERERPTACPWCHQVLALAGSCASSIVVMRDETFDRIRYGNETFFNETESPELSLAPDPRCPDCNVVVEGWHHGDCAVEQCVQCGGPLAECDCDVQATQSRTKERSSVAWRWR
jgi:hypothetical protein